LAPKRVPVVFPFLPSSPFCPFSGNPSWAWVSDPHEVDVIVDFWHATLAATLQQRFKIKFEKQKERVRRRCSPPGVKLLETEMPSPADREALVASFMTRQDQDKKWWLDSKANL
jgi:hypothetical protein